jgi:hypothetical protein
LRFQFRIRGSRRESAVAQLSTPLRAFEFMRPVTKRALIAAVVMAVVSGILTAPELITQIIGMIVSFVLIFGVLLLCLRFLPVASWSLTRQRAFIWLIAVGICAAFTFMPLAIHHLT